MAEWCRMFRVSLTDFPGQDYSTSLFRKEWTSTFKCQTSSVHRISGLDHAECGGASKYVDPHAKAHLDCL